MPDRLFLYGTLLPELVPGEVRHFVARLRPIGPAAVRGRLFDLGPYPGAVPDDEADTHIRGRLFEVPDDPQLLAALDAYEGFRADDPAGSLFVRERRSAFLENGDELPCWMYAYRRRLSSARPIPHGDWVAHRGVAETQRKD